MKDKNIEGRKITGVFTINSMYAQGKVGVYIGKEEARMDVKDILLMMKEQSFAVEQNRKYKHLSLLRK